MNLTPQNNHLKKSAEKKIKNGSLFFYNPTLRGAPLMDAFFFCECDVLLLFPRINYIIVKNPIPQNLGEKFLF